MWIGISWTFGGCLGPKLDPGSDLPPYDGPAGYEGQVKPIFDARCIGCHASTVTGRDREGAAVGVDFDTYESARRHGEEGVKRAINGSMPPSKPLTAMDRAILNAWRKKGFPRVDENPTDEDAAVDAPIDNEESPDAPLGTEMESEAETADDSDLPATSE